MKISHVNASSKTKFIEVRQYANSIVSISQETKPTKSEFCNGFWRVKSICTIPNEYASNYEFIKK
jgi:hypothetical protein